VQEQAQMNGLDIYSIIVDENNEGKQKLPQYNVPIGCFCLLF